MRPFPHSEIDLALDAANFGTRYVADISREHMARLLADPAAAGLREEPAWDTFDTRPLDMRQSVAFVLLTVVFFALAVLS